MTFRHMNRPIFMTTLALALGLTACDDAYWIIEQARKGGNAPGGSATGGTTPGTPATGGSSGQSACTSDVLGGEAVCLDVSTLKENAYYACEKRGLSFTDYAPYESCGTQLYRFVKFTCCPRVEPPPPPPPPPPPACISESQGGPTSCKDVGTWKRYASEACAAQGLALNDYAPFEDCGNGNTRYVKYVCCGAAPPPPPPPLECTSESQGSETSCKDVATWKQYASQACAAKGAALNDYAPYEDCGNGNTRYVKYVCCTPAK